MYIHFWKIRGQLSDNSNFNIYGGVGSSPNCVRKKPARQIQKNLRNIICYSCYEPSKDGTCYTFLVSLIVPLSWSEWILSYFLTGCKIFLKITHQTVLREMWPNMALFFSKVGFRKFVLASELFVLRPYFICHLTAKRAAKILWLPLQFIFRNWWLKPQLKRKIWNYTSLLWILLRELGIIQELNLDISSHVSITLWCELCS